MPGDTPVQKSTHIIEKSRIESILSMKEYIETIENAFKLYGEGRVQMPSKVYLYFDTGDLRCMPVYIPDLNIAGVKNVNVHPQNKGMPAVMATITLFDPETGYPLAFMDGTHITNMRTGAAGGVAAKYLSLENSEKAAFIGAGEQARTQMEALLTVRPGINDIAIYDIDNKKAEGFAEHARKYHQRKAYAMNSLPEALSDADIVVTTTPARAPVIKPEYLKEGVHINAIGADAAGKQELDTGILKNGVIVIDNWEQASHSGEINVGLSKGIITRDDIYGDIGEIVTGKKKGRTEGKEITIFDSTGLAVQDISSAVEIYRRIISSKKEAKKITRVDIV